MSMPALDGGFTLLMRGLSHVAVARRSVGSRSEGFELWRLAGQPAAELLSSRHCPSCAEIERRPTVNWRLAL